MTTHPVSTKLLLIAIATWLITRAVGAATISGDVTSAGGPVRGALVTVFSEDKLVSETVLTDAVGHYHLATDLRGHLTLRARAPLSADSSGSLEVVSADARVNRRFVLRRLTSPQEISDNLPASAHFARIKFPTLVQRQQFQTDCVPCHRIGSPLTRRPRPLDEWTAVMRTMVPLSDYTTDFHVADYAAALSHAFDGRPTAAHENTAVDPEALKARIIEWKLPQSRFPHDTAVYPPNGMLYTVDQFVDNIYITDRKTNKTTVVALPALGIPIGGTFAGASGVPDWVPKGVRHSNHSLALSPIDGMFYTTESVGGALGVFDPLTHAYKVNQIGGDAGVVAWPHTIRFDSKGVAWFNTYLSDQIGRFDTRSRKWTIIQLPKKAARRDDPKDERIPAPYGLDINPLDDSVWYTQVWANMVGRLDPTTMQVTEWLPPIAGPHRARFDSTGGFWIAGIGDGTITRLDTKSMKYERYTIPALADDEVEAPYGLVVDERTQDVWVTANQSDRMFRFSPRAKAWTAYPLPTRGLYFREIAITTDGWACAPSSPVPAEDYPGDGSTLSLICVQPEGNRSGGPEQSQ